MSTTQSTQLVPMTRLSDSPFLPVAPGIGRLCTIFVNLYAVDLPDDKWLLIDTGLPFSAWYVRQAVQSRYGAKARPEAIVLTHGHFDHAGNAAELSRGWDIPIYAHSMELPYLQNRSDYPPQDPTPGGAISFLSRFFPTHGIDLGDRVQALPSDGSIPSLAGWRYIHTPGHTSGHISLLRESDGVLIAGDAVTTLDMDAWTAQFTWPRKLSRPPTPLTPDWIAARDSIHRLADINPKTIAAGHGLPIVSQGWGTALSALADAPLAPPRGRYTQQPAGYRPDGSVADVPPPAPDPLPANLILSAICAAVALALIRPPRQSIDQHAKRDPGMSGGFGQ